MPGLAATENGQPGASGRLLFVRHGETEWNRSGLCQGWRDIPLDETGEAQARSLASRLGSWRVDRVISSDLLRARRTAEVIAEPHGLDVEVSVDLREFRFGEVEGQSLARIKDTPLGRRWLAWKRGLSDEPLPGGESVAEVAARMGRGIEAVLAGLDGGTVAFVGHGSSLRVALCALLGFDLRSWRSLMVENGSLSVVEVWRGARRLAMLNDACHLGHDRSGGAGPHGDTAVRDWVLAAEETG